MLAILPAAGQKFLLLEKLGSPHKRIKVQVGNSMRYQLKDDPKEWYGGRVLDFTDSAVILDNDIVPIKHVKAVDIRNLNKPGHFTLSKFAPYLIIAGVGYMAIFQLNQLYLGDGLTNSPRVWRTSGYLVGFGALMLLIKPRKFVVRGKKRLRIVNLSNVNAGLN